MGAPGDKVDLRDEAWDEWVLGCVEAEPLPLADLLDVMRRAAAREQAARAVMWGDLVLDALAQRRDASGTVDTLLVLADAGGPTRDIAARCRQRLDAVFRTRSERGYLDAAGFGGSQPAAACLRRLRLLLDLDSGTICLDKTWGLGVVVKRDAFYGKVMIDFEGTPAHAMTFAHAADALTLPPDDHILVACRRDPAAMARRVRDDPAEVVRLALESYGAMPVAELRERLEAGIVAPDDWKRFWDAARQQLKNDPLIEIPARRAEPIRRLHGVKAFDDAWFDGLARASDMDTIMEWMRDLEAGPGWAELTDAQRAVLGDRLAFVALGSETRLPRQAAMACMTAARAGVADGPVMRRVARDLLDGDRLAATLEDLPARERAPWLAYARTVDAAALRDALLAMLDVCSVRVLDEAIDALEAMGEGQPVVARIRELIARPQPPVTVLCRLVRQLAWTDRHGLCSRDELLMHGVDALERDVTAHELKARHLLRAALDQNECLETLLDALAAPRRRDFVKRVMRADRWDAADRRSIMARAIKRYPELARAAEESAPAAEPAAAVRLTSWRSYRERQAALRRLVEVDIPENSREIGVARSYGDLRENFEYQAARDLQRLLMQRQADMEADLKAVKGSDFAAARVDRAGMGTCVWIGRDGRPPRRVCILGEWDRDDALGIVSAGSALADALSGKQLGDTAVLPGDDTAAAYRIERVTPLDADIVAWMRLTDAPVA